MAEGPPYSRAVGVQVEHEIDEGAFKPGAGAFVEAETGRRSNRPLEVKDIQLFAEVEMLFWFKGKLRFFSPDAHHGIVIGRSPDGRRVTREIGYGHKQGFLRSLKLLELLLKGLDIV